MCSQLNVRDIQLATSFLSLTGGRFYPKLEWVLNLWLQLNYVLPKLRSFN
jgi:hypothetical protein